MKALPKAFLDSLQGIEGFNKEAFEDVHAKGEKVTSIRINPAKWKFGIDQGTIFLNDYLSLDQQIPWTEFGYYLNTRPSFTFDPVFHAGSYYVQEASSMFIEQAFKQLINLKTSLKVLDISAAPGGKSTHIQSLISNESLLVCNEVIRGRSNILRDNIIKWGSNNVIVTNNDPSAFHKLGGYFDVMLVDAPCSGSGLFRRDEDAIDEWSLNNVQLCSQRQQRILADVLPALKEDGLLIYSTCSYSTEEDEQIADWLVNNLEMENIKVSIDEGWNIVTTESPITKSSSYRFYPDKLKGEGFFISCFRKRSSSKNIHIKPAKPEFLSSKEKQLVDRFIDFNDISFIRNNNKIIAIQQAHLHDLYYLKNFLNIQYAGLLMGEIMKGRLVPDHALALSSHIADDVPDCDLDYDNAIKYLQRQDIYIQPAVKGWQTVSYKNYKLGWINALSNRINNYYPKELRILKQVNDTAFEK